MATKTFAKPLKTAHHKEKAHKSSDTNKDRALAALLESRTIVAAAQKAQVGESTLRRWLREDEEFQQKLRQRRQQALGHVALRLQQRASEAVEALFDSLASDKRVEPGRAAMLRTALDFAFRAGSYNDLAERLDTLERAAEDRKSAPQSTNDVLPRRHEDQSNGDHPDLLAALNGPPGKPPIQ
jgi:hypothetical protein